MFTTLRESLYHIALLLCKMLTTFSFPLYFPDIFSKNIWIMPLSALIMPQCIADMFLKTLKPTPGRRREAKLYTATKPCSCRLYQTDLGGSVYRLKNCSSSMPLTHRRYVHLFLANEWTAALIMQSHGKHVKVLLFKML